MAGEKLFGRRVRLTYKPASGEPATRIEGKAIDRDGFDISFEIDKTLQSEPNKGRITVFNLPEDLRAKLQPTDEDIFELEAGYKTTSALIFKGDHAHVTHRLNGGDWETAIEAGEGMKAYRKSYAAKSFGAGTPFKTVVEYVVKTFEGFKVTPAITRTLSNIGKSFPNGLTIDGQSAKVLNEILKQGGLEFSIQNGEIQMVKTDTQASDAPPIKLDYSSGLVDVPQSGEKAGKPVITFQSLIQPGLVPGRKVKLDVKGDGFLKEVKCVDVKIRGSNFDTEFYCYVDGEVPK